VLQYRSVYPSDLRGLLSEMSVLSLLLNAAGAAGLLYTAWIASLFKGSGGSQENSLLYMYCAASFALVVLGQLAAMKLVPAIVTAGREPTIAERSSLHEFRTFSVRQGEYHKRAQAAAGTKEK